MICTDVMRKGASAAPQFHKTVQVRLGLGASFVLMRLQCSTTFPYFSSSSCRVGEHQDLG
jgi:hypothetical protein